MSSTTFNLKNINFMSESKYDSLTEIKDDELYAVKFDINSCNLLDFKWSDHILNDISWLRADTFSWQNGELYESAYNHLVEDLKAEILYAWSDENTTIYTKTEALEAGSPTYTSSGELRGSIIAGDRFAITSLVGNTLTTKDGLTLTRDNSSDIVNVQSIAIEPQTETIGSNTITYYQAEDGHKIVLPDMEETVANIYDESGVAWYYILDVENKLFKLPRTKFGFTGLRDAVGNYVYESLPNITGYFDNRRNNTANTILTGGAFTYEKRGGSDSYFYGNNNTSNGYKITFNASNSSSTYQDNAPVQQRATQMYLYFYVGQFSKTAVEQTAGVTTETLNGKLDIDAGNATSDTVNTLVGLANSTAKQTIVGWGMPDYSASVSFSTGSNYTVPKDGIIVWNGSNSDVHTQTIKINNTTIISHANNAGYDAFVGFLPVRKGDVVLISIGTQGSSTNKFYPLKGA